MEPGSNLNKVFVKLGLAIMVLLLILVIYIFKSQIGLFFTPEVTYDLDLDTEPILLNEAQVVEKREQLDVTVSTLFDDRDDAEDEFEDQPPADLDEEQLKLYEQDGFELVASSSEDFFEMEVDLLSSDVVSGEDTSDFVFSENEQDEEAETAIEVPLYTVSSNDDSSVGQVIVTSDLDTSDLVDVSVSGIVYGLDFAESQLVLSVDGTVTQVYFDDQTKFTIAGQQMLKPQVDFFDIVTVNGQSVIGGLEIKAASIDITSFYAPVPEI